MNQVKIKVKEHGREKQKLTDLCLAVSEISFRLDAKASSVSQTGHGLPLRKRRTSLDDDNLTRGAGHDFTLIRLQAQFDRFVVHHLALQARSGAVAVTRAANGAELALGHAEKGFAAPATRHATEDGDNIIVDLFDVGGDSWDVGEDGVGLCLAGEIGDGDGDAFDRVSESHGTRIPGQSSCEEG